MTRSWPLAFLSFTAGILMAYQESWWLTVAIAAVLLITALYWREIRNRVFLCLLIVTAGIVYFNLAGSRLPANLLAVEKTSLTGRINDFPRFEQDKTSFFISPDKAGEYSQNIRVVCLFDAPVKRGDRVSLQGSLKPPRRPGNPGEFDYAAYLAHNGVFYTLTVKEPAKLKLVKQGTGVLKGVDFLRDKGADLIRQTLPARESSILLGMLLGTRDGIDEEQYEDFQKTGIVHLFSVSGLHVAFLLLLITWLTSLMRMSARGRFFTAAAILLLYGTMIAWPECVIRAVLMGILGLLAYYSGRENSLLNALAISGLVILIINPNAIFLISFQLTMLATWGLVYLFPVLRDHFPYQGKLWDLLLIPVAAELAVLPLIAYHFNMFAPVSIITNILVSYLSGVAVVCGFISLLLAPAIPAGAAIFLYPAGLCVEIILYIVELMKTVPGGFIWVAAPGVILTALYYAALLMGCRGLKEGRRSWGVMAGGLMLLFLVVLLLPASIYHKGFLEISFIDVGQGDSILLKTPRGKFLLVDGGGSELYDTGSRTVLPYLHRRGIRELFMAVNTHPDWDHLGGLQTVTTQMPVKYIGLPASVYNCEEYRGIKKSARYSNSRVLELYAGQNINLEKDLQVKVLHPGRQDAAPEGFNDDSVVLLICYREFSILLTGDVNTQALQTIMKGPELKPVTVVKVPHHGSKGSLLPGFYEKIQPRYAVISVGNNNIFGHPHPEVIDVLKKNHIKIMRTDQSGAVTVLSDGSKMKIRATVRPDSQQMKKDSLISNQQ